MGVNRCFVFDNKSWNYQIPIRQTQSVKKRRKTQCLLLMYPTLLAEFVTSHDANLHNNPYYHSIFYIKKSNNP